MSTRPAKSGTDLTQALRNALSGLRDAPAARAAASPTAVPAAPAAAVPRTGRILNASGRLFGRDVGTPPLAEAARRALEAAIARPFAAPAEDVEAALRALTGAEAALVLADAGVALHAVIAAHVAPGGEVVVSRGDLYEQDGGLRVPDLVTEAGAQLFEVGSVDRTTVSDYADAITPATRLLLQLHRPVAAVGDAVPTLAAIAAIGRAHRIATVHGFAPGALDAEGAIPGLRGLLSAGADLLVVPADRLIGGPRAGLVLGRAGAVTAVGRLAIARAAALDGRMRAALAATLALHRDAAVAAEHIPVLRLLRQDRLVLAERAARLASLLGAAPSAIVPTRPAPGAGIRLGRAPESAAVAVPPELGPHLAARPVPVVTASAPGRVLLDVLALADAELGEVAEAVRAAAQG